MPIDVERLHKTFGKVTLNLGFIMFHCAALQGHKAALRTQCVFDPFTTMSRFSGSQGFVRKDENRQEKWDPV